MGESKSREKLLTELLKTYQRRFRPVYMSLVSKEEFLDIINVEQRSLDDDTKQVKFTEETWTRIKYSMVKGFENLEFSDMILNYFPDPAAFEFQTKCNDNVCALVWKYDAGRPGESYFEKSGAAMIREMHQYWIIMLFTNEIETHNDYENEMESLGRIITGLQDIL